MESDLILPRYIMIRDLSLRRESGGLDTIGGFEPGPGLLSTSPADDDYSDATEPPQPVIEVFDGLSKSDVHDARRDPEIAAFAPVMPTTLIRPASTTETDVDGPGGDLWGLEATGAIGSTRTGEGVSVAVLDTGIDRHHETFSGVAIEEVDFTGSGDADVQGHGTHCAGTIFGGSVDGKRIGMAPAVSRALIAKVLGDDGGGDSAWLLDGINWAFDKGANVLSMSLGFDFPGMVARQTALGWPVAAATSAALEAYRQNVRVFDRLVSMLSARGGSNGGMLIVAAAGNESARYSPKPYEIAASLPAAADCIFAVGALRRTDEGLAPANFSNTFPQISGPGVSILSAQTGGGLVPLNGTSMACPHVAGAACLWWEELTADPFQVASPATVGARLLATARTDRFAPNVDPADCGAGLVTAP
ncbi:MAG: S8 family serine peptidase [Pseudomonadota bacterium]